LLFSVWAYETGKRTKFTKDVTRAGIKRNSLNGDCIIDTVLGSKGTKDEITLPLRTSK
jgi:hypothetical protein